MPVRISDLLKMGTKHYSMVAAETMARHAENFQARAAIVKSVILEDTEVIAPRLLWSTLCFKESQDWVFTLEKR